MDQVENAEMNDMGWLEGLFTQTSTATNTDDLDHSFTDTSEWNNNGNTTFPAPTTLASPAHAVNHGYNVLNCEMTDSDENVTICETSGHIIPAGCQTIDPLDCTMTHHSATESESSINGSVPLSFESDTSSSHCSQLLQLVNNVEHNLNNSRSSDSYPIDVVLAATQRHNMELLRLLENPNVQTTYSLIMLSSVALGKMISLLIVGKRDFDTLLGGRVNAGTSQKLVHFGAFDIDPSQQRAICITIFLREVKRTRQCLSQITAGMNQGNVLCGTSGNGRHEGYHDDMERTLDRMITDLVSDSRYS
jgi:hypothetical protein